MSSTDESVLYRLRNLKDHSVIAVHKEQFKIGRATTNDLAIANNRYISTSHCFLQFEHGRVYLRDTSSNGTLLNRIKKIHKNDSPIELQSGDIIHLVFRKDEPEANVIFQLDFSVRSARTTEQKLKRKLSDMNSTQSPSSTDRSMSSLETKENVNLTSTLDTSSNETIKQRTTDTASTSKMDSEMEDVLTCVCCQDLMNDPICLEPCLHAFCNSCYSSWEAVQRTCPKCRVKVTGKKKNVVISGILEAYLKANPQKRPVLQPIDNQSKCKVLKTSTSTHHINCNRMVVDDTQDDEEEDDDDDNNDDDDEEMNEDDADDQEDESDSQLFFLMRPSVRNTRFVCRQCPATGFGGAADASVIQTGFQCTPNQTHILCQCCVQPMPDRQDVPGVHQSCELCHQHFCHLYYQQCQRQGCLGCLNQLRNLNFSPRHLTNLVNDNPVETQIVQNYLTAHHMTMQDLLLECCKRLDRKEFTCTDIDRTHAVPSKKVTCYKCGLNIFKQLAYQFRISLKQNEILPVAMRNRDNCYYGKQCRTQYTKPAHAQKLNHACEQTRFQ